MSKVDTIYLVRGPGSERILCSRAPCTYVITRLTKRIIAAVGLEPDLVIGRFGSSFSGFPTLVEIDKDRKVTKSFFADLWLNALSAEKLTKRISPYSFRMAESN